MRLFSYPTSPLKVMRPTDHPPWRNACTPLSLYLTGRGCSRLAETELDLSQSTPLHFLCGRMSTCVQTQSTFHPRGERADRPSEWTNYPRDRPARYQSRRMRSMSPYLIIAFRLLLYIACFYAYFLFTFAVNRTWSPITLESE